MTLHFKIDENKNTLLYVKGVNRERRYLSLLKLGIIANKHVCVQQFERKV